MIKVIRKSTGLISSEPYACKKDWPEDCFCQAGSSGIVFTGHSMAEVFVDKNPDALAEVAGALIGVDPPSSYRTAFFEAFSQEPDTFLRGEGKTVEEAEEQAWKQFERIRACAGHEMEKRGYTNGGGFCKNCDLFLGNAFPAEEK